MQLSKKTTILFSPELHERLLRLAARRGTSLGGLVREACEAHYGLVPWEERAAAVEELASLTLPVASPTVIERESVPQPEDLLPEERRKRGRRTS
ncbi:MAG: hypothetical protein GEU90_09300 [Gemmatimonas sp.]|nr:hypothetical protein [Gemmatimonas sp.]